MLELDSIIPCFERMAGVTIFCCPFTLEAVDVVFFMTGHTRGLAAEVTRVSGLGRSFFHFRFVTLHTLNVGVFSFEHITSELRVIEVFFVNRHCVEISAFVLGVTLFARLSRHAVKAFFRCHKTTDVFVALQTF